jgi:hypothetical protein
MAVTCGQSQHSYKVSSGSSDLGGEKASTQRSLSLSLLQDNNYDKYKLGKEATSCGPLTNSTVFSFWFSKIVRKSRCLPWASFVGNEANMSVLLSSTRFRGQ